MNDLMELRRRTWIAALKLALVISTLAALVAVVASSIGEVPATAIVLPVAIVAFVASWVQTGRIRQGRISEPAMIRARTIGTPTA